MKAAPALLTTLIASALLVLPAVHAQEKAGVVVAGTVETIVTVVDVDRDARVVTNRHGFTKPTARPLTPTRAPAAIWSGPAACCTGCGAM